uniref:Uncharacterized protein n=1 Tax=Rhizophora mucronata TaxID=61149 RepID=A0A2P2PV72_RHIMU
MPLNLFYFNSGTYIEIQSVDQTKASKALNL